MKNRINGALTALAAMASAGMALLAGGVAQADVKKAPKPTEREIRIFAEASYLSVVSATNYLAITPFMDGRAKADMQDFAERMVLDGNQCFMPDFFKLKHSVVGAYDEKGFVVGFYNPFYDAWLMLKVSDSPKVSINGFKVVAGEWFTGLPGRDWPQASGTVPAEPYLIGVYEQEKKALFSMRDKFAGGNFRTLFDQMPSADETLVARLAEVTKFRIGQALKISGDKRVLRDAVICNAIICKGSVKHFVSDDASTKLTLKTLAGSLEALRSGFKAIAYFPSGDESNLVYSNRQLPTLLVHANVSAEGKVWLRMFDVNTISANIK